MEDSKLLKLIRAFERTSGGSLSVSDRVIELYNEAMRKKTGKKDFSLEKAKLKSDAFKRNFAFNMLTIYKKAYEDFFNMDCHEEALTRFWFGGLYGYQSSYTDSYWEEVSKYYHQ